MLNGMVKIENNYLPKFKIKYFDILPNTIFSFEEFKTDWGSLNETSSFGHSHFLFKKQFENVRWMTHFDILVRMKKVDIFGCEKNCRFNFEAQTCGSLFPTVLFNCNRHSNTLYIKKTFRGLERLALGPWKAFGAFEGPSGLLKASNFWLERPLKTPTPLMASLGALEDALSPSRGPGSI